MTRIVTRTEWSARPPKATPAKVAIASRTATCTHHDGKYPVIIRNFAEACARIRSDQNYHMDGNGWNDIGYNYLVISAPGTDVDGMIFEGRGRDIIGAHCLNWNTPWIGIQVATGGDQIPSPAALVSVRWLHDSFEGAAGHGLGKKVHSDGFNTACPGPFLKSWVHSGMPVTTQAGSSFPTIPTIPTLEADMPITNDDADVIVKRLLGTLISEDMVVKTALQRAAAPATVDITALAAAIVAALPSGGSTVTAAQIAKAVNDDAARRLVA